MHWGHPKNAKVALFCGDAFLALAAALVCLGPVRGAQASMASQLWGAVVSTLVFLSLAYIFDLYHLRGNTRLMILCRLFAVCGAHVLVSSAWLFVFPIAAYGPGSIVLVAITAGGACYGCRCLYLLNPQLFVKRRPVLIVGTAQDARTIAAVLRPDDPCYELAGYMGEAPLDDSDDGGTPLPLSARYAESDRGQVCVSVLAELAPCAYFGPVEAAALRLTLNECGVEVLAINSRVVPAELASLLTNLRFEGVRIYTIPDFHMRLCEELPLEMLTHDWLSFAGGFDLLESRVFRRIKRLTDLFLAGAGLILALPLMLLTAVAIKIDSPGPVFFSQTRVGWKGTPYQLLKFRSMRQDAEANGAQWAQLEDPRVTRVGRWIRKFRIDEIPQMFHVLAGQMSFVGPRPERPEFVLQLEQLIPFYHLRHYVPPGITGWAQVQHPYGASVEDARRKLQFDLYYIRSASPLVDLRILLRTVRTVLFSQGSR